MSEVNHQALFVSQEPLKGLLQKHFKCNLTQINGLSDIDIITIVFSISNRPLRELEGILAQRLVRPLDIFFLLPYTADYVSLFMVSVRDI